MSDKAVEDLTEAEAKAELTMLAQRLAAADLAYHRDDTPEITDAEYDALKSRNAQIEQIFSHLKRSDSPSEAVGARPADGFAKVVHAQRMMSLANAFDDTDVADFVEGIRKFLGLGNEQTLDFTA